MSKKYYWQHEDTGRVCVTESSLRPSSRWYKISAKAYRAHEAQANKSVQRTELCPVCISVKPEGSVCKVCGVGE